MSALLFEILAVTRFAVGSNWSDFWRALKVIRETTGFSLYWVEWTVNNVARNTAHYSTHWQLLPVSDTSMTQLTQRQTDRRVTCLPLTRMAVIDGARLSTTFVSRLEQNRTTALPHTQTDRHTHTRTETLIRRISIVDVSSVWTDMDDHRRHTTRHLAHLERNKSTGFVFKVNDSIMTSWPPGWLIRQDRHTQTDIQLMTTTFICNELPTQVLYILTYKMLPRISAPPPKNQVHMWSRITGTCISRRWFLRTCTGCRRSA